MGGYGGGGSGGTQRCSQGEQGWAPSVPGLVLEGAAAGQGFLQVPKPGQG